MPKDYKKIVTKKSTFFVKSGFQLAQLVKTDFCLDLIIKNYYKERTFKVETLSKTKKKIC